MVKRVGMLIRTLGELDLKRRISLHLVFILLCCGVLSLAAAEYYVAPDGSSANPGLRDAPWSVAKANATLTAGDTAILLDGTYTGAPIAPARSGEDGNYIVYRAENRQKAVFENIDALPDSRGPAAIFVSKKSYIAVDGIKVTGVKRWLLGVRSHHITLANGYFEKGSGWINCRFEENGDGIRISNNYFSEGTDLLSIDGGDGHLIEDNFFGDASHTGLVLLGVQRSVVRNNKLTNRWWRCMEVESQRHEPFRLSMVNLIEGNVFDYSPTAAIQYAGNRSIIRRNIFRRCLTGMNWANYLGRDRTPEAWHDESNRFYNNVVSECGTNDVVLQIIAENKANGIDVEERVSDNGFGMVYATNLFNPPVPGYDDVAYGDNVVVNNIFYLNANTTEQSDGKGKKASRTTHIAFDWNATPEFGRFYTNDIFSDQPGAEVFYFCDAVYMHPPEPRNRLIESFEARYPEWADDNIKVDPLFIDPDNGDYQLQSGSPCIDAGRALTTAAAAGEGAVLPVKDAIYFTDGYGLVEADVIRVEDQRVKILKVDYDTNTLTLEKAISWPQDAPIYLDYEGDAPDLGAFEVGASSGIKNKSEMPQAFDLRQNYPNPFNASTVISFTLPKETFVKLEIYNQIGQTIAVLVDEKMSAGKHSLSWRPDHLSSGIYFVRMNAGGKIAVNKSVLIQ